MKTLNIDTYEIAYSDEEYRDADDYSDLITALANEYERSYERFYKEFKLDKRKKKIGNDDDQRALHKIALQIEVGLDSATRQFFAHLLAPDQTFMNERYFNKDFIKPDEDKSSANSLKNKLNHIRKFIDEFQSRHKTEIRRAFRYAHGRLYYTPAKYVSFKTDGFPSALLTVLFDKFTEIYDNQKLTQIVIYQHPSLNQRLDFDDQSKLKKVCEQINTRVKKEADCKVNLIVHNTKTTSLNPMAFHKIDRIQFDNYR